VTKKRIPILFTLFILSALFVAASLAPSAAPSAVPPTSQVQPLRDLTLPENQTGAGYPMNLTESVNGFKPDTLNTTNSFSTNYVKPHNDSFSVQTLTNYGTVWQTITVSNIVAERDFMAVQDGYGASGLKCGSQGLANGQYSMLAINFTVPERVNLTSVWIRYGAFQDIGAKYPPVIPLKIETDSGSHVPSGTALGSGNLQNDTGPGWHEVQVRDNGKPVTLQSGTVYWLVIDGSSIPGGNDGYYVWYYVSDKTSPSYDSKCIAAYSGAWILENPSFSAINFLSVLVVKAVDASLATMVYSSPSDVDMRLNGTLISGSTVSVDPSKKFFNFTTIYSVSFTANWTARFERFRLEAVSANYIAREGFTLWNATFISDVKPVNLYTWYNKTFKVSAIPQNWSRTSPPTNVTTYPIVFTSLLQAGLDYYNITQLGDINSAPKWDTNWTVSALSTYKISATLSTQVVAGLPFTLTILSTTPHSHTVCNASFYNSTGDLDPVNSYIFTINPPPYVLRPIISKNGDYTLFLFDTWIDGNDVSFNKTLTIKVLSPDRNLTVNDRSSPVVGNTAMLRFKFYNNSLGAGNTWMEPEDVSVNGTLIPPSNRSYDGENTTVYMSTASGGWHTGNNTIMVSAKSGVFNCTEQTWILVQEPLCNVTVIVVNQPFPGNNGSLSFKFFNKTVGATQLLIDPTFVRINGTDASFTSSGNTVTVTWNTTLGGWHVGVNYVNLSAQVGIFINSTVVPFNIIPALCNVTVVGEIDPILGNNASLSFRFFNNTAGATPPFINPTSVRINGTDAWFTFSSDVVTVVWNTTLGGWHAGLNYVNVSATGGVFGSFTIEQINIIQPSAELAFEESDYNGTYGDAILIGFKLTNGTAGGSNALAPSVLYVNGTSVAFTSHGGWYIFSLDTRTLSSAGSYSLNFTALYGQFYVGADVTAVVVSKIPMTIVLHLGQTSVTAGSSLSASATLSYDNGTKVEDGTEVVFRFTATYANSTIRAFNVTALTLNGTSQAAFTATREMKNISVEVIYNGDGIRAFASDTKPSITVTLPTGIPVILIGGAGGIGALVVGLAVVVLRRRKRGKEVEYKKTAALRQAASLAQLVVVERKAGRAVFSRNLSTEESVDPHLISGFLSANESILQEVFRGDKECLRYADYGKYKVITCIGEYVMTTLFCAVSADRQLEGVLELEDVLSKFTKEFERRYGRLVSVWDGDMIAFRGAESIVSDVFAEGISMLSPYTLDRVALARAKLSGLENDAFEKADRLSSGRGVFFITKVIEYLLTEKRVSRGKAMDAIDSLVKKGVFKQISMSEAEEAVRKASSSST
jgi:hypothetical protein